MMNSLSSLKSASRSSLIESLFSMKKMIGTEGFLKLHHTITKCSEDKREDCENSRYLEASRKECGCLPWTLKDVTEGKVGPGKHKMLSKLATQSFNILRLIARNPIFLRPKVPYFNVSRLSRLSTLFPISN